VRIDQWVPTLHRGDAIGDSARLMRDAFRRWGFAADVYALELDDELVGDGRSWADWRPGGPGDVVILHYALPSPLTAALQQYPGRRVLLHHNITPPEFFAGYDDEMVRICTLGRTELAGLAPHVELGLADSEFNRLELEAAGCRRTGVLPIYLDLSPNKRHEDLIRLVSYWKQFIAPDVRLLLVGKLPQRNGYYDALQRLMYEEALTPADVVFTGHVSHDDLLACYATAGVFVSMSEHEGFGVPLVEAMLMGVPVLAFRAAAVPHTLGEAGIQFDQKRIPEVAELAYCLATDQDLRRAVIAGQRRRLPAFAPAAVEAALRSYLESL
jgi:glycosyltransferase involved in cell wall biosynthesis